MSSKQSSFASVHPGKNSLTMEHKNEKEIRTGTKNILICKCREENGIPTLEFIHQKKKDKMTVDELLKKIYGK